MSKQKKVIQLQRELDELRGMVKDLAGMVAEVLETLVKKDIPPLAPPAVPTNPFPRRPGRPILDFPTVVMYGVQPADPLPDDLSGWGTGELTVGVSSEPVGELNTPPAEDDNASPKEG